ncbi:MAG TPA: TonB-dependent receptor, partial [Steroidobacteraceae bacterium]|nr:TonB-dependent receptor [Steroidobacteraceae bacterium]
MSTRRHLPLAGSALLLVTQAMPALAASIAATEEDEMREVIVTAKSLEVTTPLELSKLGYDVEFLTNEQVKRQGFVDVTQALEMLVPGAFVTTQAGAFSYVNLSLQGSRTADVLWTVDGVRINNRLYNGTSPADTLPASMIERIEVLKGGQGLLYGTQAAAGVINIVTKAFTDTPDGAVSLGGDSRDGLHANGYVRGALGEHHFVAWASKDKSDGYSLYDNYQPGASTRDRAYNVDSYGLKYGFNFTDDLRLTLQGVHTEAALDYPSPTETDQNRRNEEILSGRLDYKANDQVQLFVKGYVHDWDSHFVEDVTNPSAAFWGFKDYGVSAAAQLNLTRGLQYDVGVDYQRYHGRDEVLLIEGLTEKAQAVFAQLRTTDDLSTRAHFTAGLRYNDTGGAKATVWSASSVYNLTESLFIEGSLGTSFLLPDAYELYAIDPTDTRGNPDLKPEESFNINLAIGGRIEAGARPLAWQITGWRRRIKNLIIDDDTNPPAGFDTVFINSDGRVKTSGVELLLRGSLTNALSFDTSYMFSRERDPNTGRQLQNRPKNSGKLGLTWEQAGSPFGASIAVKYGGSTYANFQ